MPRRALLPGLPILVLLACDRPVLPPPGGPAPISPPDQAATAVQPPPPPEPVPPSPLFRPLPAPEPQPLQAPGPFVDLPVEGYAPAVVSVPVGAQARRPVVVATHGNFDRPEWQCEVWRAIVKDRAFVLCPRGVQRPDSPRGEETRFTYPTNQVLEREVAAGLAALRDRFPEHADVDRPLYTGFSLGAIMGVSIAARLPSQYPRLVLIEGGHDKWSAGSAAAFAKGGGKRVLFVCSRAYCHNDATQAARSLAAAGVAVHVARGPDVGHTYDGPIAATTKRELGWLLEGDARWGEEGGGADAGAP